MRACLWSGAGGGDPKTISVPWRPFGSHADCHYVERFSLQDMDYCCISSCGQNELQAGATEITAAALGSSLAPYK